MNPFDSIITDFLYQFSQLSHTADFTITFLSNNNLVKGDLLITVFWWGWFRVNNKQPSIQVHLIATSFSCFIALAVTKALSSLLPLRLPPMHEEGLDFTLPYSMELKMLQGWSSFPSDHAVLFYALSTGMFYISKKVGIFAFVYTTIFISLPRVYLGFHYPTDIIAGAIVGIVITLLCNSNSFIEKKAQSAQKWARTKPEIFYPIFSWFTGRRTSPGW